MNKNDYKKNRRKPGGNKFTTNKKSIESKIDSVKESANDPAWYTVNGQIVKDVASLSFNNPLGSSMTLSAVAGYGTAPFNSSVVNVPGIMSIYLAPTPGTSTDMFSPLNVAAKNLYTFIRHANSGHANYDSPDLMIYLIAMANCYAMYGWMTRLYGLAMTYTQKNRYYGKCMIDSQGVNYEEFSENLANFRVFINNFALKLSAFAVPTSMSLFKRYIWMFSNAFKDEDVTKAQVYMYNPAFFYRYVESNAPGYLEPIPVCVTGTGERLNPRIGMSVGDIMGIAAAMLTPIVGSEDMNIMSGDILKAYGSENIWKLATIDENYAIVPIFSEEVLSQIHNTRFMGPEPVIYNDADHMGEAYVSLSSFTVKQDPSVNGKGLLCDPKFTNRRDSSFTGLLDFWKEDPTPEDVIVATRNYTMAKHVVETVDGKVRDYYGDVACGSEIPLFAEMWNIDVVGDTFGQLTGYPCYNYDYWQTSLTTLNTIALAETFNLRPLTYGMFTSNSASARRPVGPISNCVPLDYETVNKMHEVALMSMFAIPILGNLVK